MLSNLKKYIFNLYIDFKRLLAENRLVLIALCASLFAGLLMSININKEVEFQGNIIILIKLNDFNVFWYLLKCSLFFALIYAVALLSKLHFFAFIGNFAVLLIFFRIVFRALILSFMFDGFFALVFFLFYWLPMLVFSLICYFRLMCRIYFILGYARCKRAPLCCPSGKVFFNVVAKGFATNLITFLIYNIIFVIVLYLVF